MTLNVTCYGQDEEQRAIDYLKNLEIEELINVEVVLDDVFNVFDGLIKSRKINVATGTQQTTERAPAITTAITAQDIEATGATNLEEVLESVPGLHISRLFFGYDPRYILRGISSFRNPEILMMINGIAIKTLFDGNRGQIWTVNAISRIEVIRGPASAVFGADAFSGVINIITKTREDINGTEVGARMGSFNTQDAWFLHGKQYGDLDAVATVEYHTTKGHQGFIEADAQTQFDALFGTTASLAPGAVNLREQNVDARLDLFWKGWRLRTGYQGRRDMGNGAGAAGALDPYAAWTDDRLNIDLTYDLKPQFIQYWDMTAQLSYFSTATDLEETQRVFPSGAFGGSYPDGFIGNPGLSERHTRFDLSGFYSGFNDHLIRIGSGYYYGDLYKVTETKNFGVDPQTGEPLPPGAPLVATTDTPFVFIPERRLFGKLYQN